MTSKRHAEWDFNPAEPQLLWSDLMTNERILESRRFNTYMRPRTILLYSITVKDRVGRLSN